MKNDFDQVSVATLEIVPIESPRSSQMIVHGPGLPRPMVLSFDESKTFEASARLMAACSMINKEKFVVAVTQLAERFLPKPSAPDRALDAVAAPGAEADSSVSTGEVDWLIEHAVAFRARCVKLGLTSEALIASLLNISMGDSAMMSLAEGAISRGISPYARLPGDPAEPPPWVIPGTGNIVVKIDEGGLVVLEIPELEDVKMSAAESSLVGAALQSASALVQRSRLSSIVDGGAGPGSAETPVPSGG